MRPISRDVRRSTEVNRGLLYEPDGDPERDAEFPPMRGKRDWGIRPDVLTGVRGGAPLQPAQSGCRVRNGEMRALFRMQRAYRGGLLLGVVASSGAPRTHRVGAGSGGRFGMQRRGLRSGVMGDSYGGRCA
jgi:hypothetical protein